MVKASRRPSALLEAEKQFRRVNGHPHLPLLRAAMQRQIEAEELARECSAEQVA